MNNIIKGLLTIVLLSIVSANINGQHKKAYQIFDVNGNKANYKLMFEQAITHNVILFGELHNNPICHWLQYELTKERRYAAMVNRGGFEVLETLSEKALSYIAPLPVKFDPELPGYKQMLEMSQMPAHVSENLPKAQAIKRCNNGSFH